MSQKKFLSLITLILLVGLFPLIANAQSTVVPDWVKNNALWWAEGKISEQEYLNAIQFLIDEGIIILNTSQSPSEPISTDFSTLFGAAQQSVESIISPFSKNIVPEGDRVVGYIVRISGGEITETQTFHTFGKFGPGEDPVFINSLQSQGFSSYFSLESLPSKDKVTFYEIISRYFNPGKTPEPFDVSIDGISGDGSTIITMNYNKCRLSDYFPYLQNFVFVYPLSNEFGPEIRDRTIFACQGFNVEVKPDKENVDLSILNSIPDDDTRAKKFVVHFFNGELEQVFSTTFANFAPSADTLENPYVSITTSGNPIGSSPQFFLESLPSYDKKNFYKFLSRYVNPGKQPELFDVSVDLITGDKTILQRWNYVDCEVTSYQMSLDDVMLVYPYSNKPQGEIKDKTDFACNGNDLLVQGIHQIDNFPIMDKNSSIKSEELALLYAKESPLENDRAMSYRIHASDGELEFTRTSDKVPIFEALAQNRGPLTPIHHAKQYDFGFYIEALPSKDKTELYDFLARYVNPGKQPEPIDVDVEVLTGDGRVIETLQYRSCTAIDMDFYSQDFSFIYQITNELQVEIREKFTFYCDGYTIDVS